MTTAAGAPDTPRSRLRSPAPRWVWRGGEDVDEAAATALEAATHLPRTLCRLLVRRGHPDDAAAKQFLKPKLSQLHDPRQLTDLPAAVERIGRALTRGEVILAHGDYDVDGISATTLYTRVLRMLGGRVVPFVPHRLQDGYDLGPAGIQAARQAGAGLILTGDCGTVAHAAVAQAVAAGIDVVVTDHHTPYGDLPAAVAVVNPNRPDCGYPNKALCGTGVAYKLCQALVAERGGDEEALRYHLDLVALATIADLVPLTGENRVLARYGLQVLTHTRKAGLRALLTVLGMAPGQPIRAGQVSHVIAPRINAVGRMGVAGRGVQLLLADTEAEAEALARDMDEENRSRRAVDREILQQALALLEESYDPDRDWGVVLAARGWHPGVIGIVASRVVERIHRPTVLIAIDESGEVARGSARSIPAFHLFRAIAACASLLDRYGGHRQAAGLELRADRIPAFREAFNREARGALRPEDLIPDLSMDLEVGLGEMTPGLLRLLRHLGPFGMGNAAPVFMTRGVALGRPPRVVGEGHVKLELRQDGARLPAIGFQLAERVRETYTKGGHLDVAYQLQEDRWQGAGAVQVRVLDVRRSA